jgi:hypothetical protein
LAALVGIGAAKLGRRSGECVVIGRKLVERHVISANKAQFLKVRIREAPAAPLVDPRAVRKHASEGALGLYLAHAFDLGIEHPFLSPFAFAGDEPQLGLQTTAEFVLGEAAWSRRSYRGQRGGAQQRDKQEVVKMAGL